MFAILTIIAEAVAAERTNKRQATAGLSGITTAIINRLKNKESTKNSGLVLQLLVTSMAWYSLDGIQDPESAKDKNLTVILYIIDDYLTYFIHI